MKPIIFSGGTLSIVVASDKNDKIMPIQDAFWDVFGRATVEGTHNYFITALYFTDHKLISLFSIYLLKREKEKYLAALFVTRVHIIVMKKGLVPSIV